MSTRAERSPILHGLPAALFVLSLTAFQVSGAGKKSAAHNEYPGKHWTQVNKPEDRGWSSDKLAAAKTYADSLDTAAVVIVDDGVVISQWGETATKFNVHSIRKTLLSALYGRGGQRPDRSERHACATSD